MKLWHCHRQPLDKLGKLSTEYKTETLGQPVVT